MAGEVAQGTFGGAASGAAAGAAFGPPGMAIGAIIGAVSGFTQGKNAKRLDQQYQKAENAVNPIDPGQQAYLQRLRQQERNYRAGSDATSAFAAQQARNVGSTTQANLLRAGGPGTVSNLLRAQAGTNNAFAQIGANASQGANQMLGMQQGLINQIAERRYNRQRELRDQAMERSVSARQNLQNMFSGALAMVPGVTANFMKSAPFDSASATSQIANSLPQGRAMSMGTTEGSATYMQPQMPQASQIPAASDRILAGYGNPAYMQPRSIYPGMPNVPPGQPIGPF